MTSCTSVNNEENTMLMEVDFPAPFGPNNLHSTYTLNP